MKFTVKKLVEIDAKTIRLIVPVRYGDDDMPYNFPFRDGDTWEAAIDIETGKINDWPDGYEYDLHMKVCDEGTYYLEDADSREVGLIDNDYVPNNIIPGEYGDYIIMQIAQDGTIKNWPKNPCVGDFFEVVEDE